MSENIERSLEQMKDVEAHEKEKKEPGLELAKGEETDELVESADNIAQALEKDEPVTEGDMKRIEEAVQNIHVDFGGEKVSLDELKRDPNMKNDLKIWQEIKNDSLNANSKIGKLTRITPEIVRIALADFTPPSSLEWQFLSLNKSKFFSDDCAEVLRENNFIGLIVLSSVKSISDNAMEIITTNRKNSINLDSLEILSDRGAMALSRLKGWRGLHSVVGLKHLKSVSEQGLNTLAKIERGIVQLPPEIESEVEKRRSKGSKFKKWLDDQLGK